MSGEENRINSKYQDLDVPNGLVFAPLRKNLEETFIIHPLDNNIAELYQVLHEIIIPACCEYSPAPKCTIARIKKILEYTIPANGFCFSFPAVLMYRFLVPEDQQIKEDMELTIILRIIIEILFTGTCILDDIVDHSVERYHKKSWHTICPGGTEAAIFDAHILYSMAFHLLKRFFGRNTVYVKMLEAINEGLTANCIGQLVDFCEKETMLFSNSNELRSYKTGQFAKSLIKLPLLHAGVTDENIIEKVQQVLCECYTAIQESNDFSNYYCPATKLGKEPHDDITNGSPTWVSQTAVAHFDEEQKKTFFSCFGSSDPAKIQTVIDLYEEINITDLFITHMNGMSKKCESYIGELSNENLKKACISIKQWLFGKIV